MKAWRFARLAAFLVVNGFRGADIGAREHRHDTQKAIAQLSAALGLRQGSLMADVGAGDGAYAVPLAKVVGPGRRGARGSNMRGLPM